MSSDEVVIDVNDLSKRYEIYAAPRDRLKQLVLPPIRKLLLRITGPFRQSSAQSSPQYFSEFWALHGVSFQVRRGETVGIVGLNGSGKSTLLQLICSTLTPTSGSVDVKGRVAALLELGSGFNPDYTGRDNVFLNGQILGLSREEIQNRFHAIEEFADIGDFIDRPVKTYSSGMTVRLAFAVAINVEPEILVVDEALAVGDIAFQRKCLAWMESFASKRGVLLFVSHSPEQVRRLCTKAIYLRHGSIVGLGDAKEICDQYEKDLHEAPGIFREDMELNDNNVVANDGKADQGELVSVLGFPECAMQYGDGRARILGAWVENVSGVRRNSFRVGESLAWCYRVEFQVSVEAPIFGFMVKTKEGISLYSANSKSLGEVPQSVGPTESLIVRFLIEPKLGAGEYFLNCGVSVDSADETEYLHRVVDAGVVSIHARDGSSVGLVNMATQLQLRYLAD